MKSLKPRLLTAAIGIPAVVLVMILAELWHPLIGIVVGLASAWMVLEYLAARKLNSIVPLSIVCMLYALLMPIVVTEATLTYMLTFLFLVLGFVVSLVYHKKLSYGMLAYALFGTLLITFGMSAVSLACVGNGYSVSFFFVLIFLLPWMADGGGYFIGSRFGRRKLCPNISPKKTVEGVLGGAVFCVASAMIMGLVFQFVVFSGDEAARVNFAALVVLAILDSVLSLIGDLSFSLIKRYLKIKDYGSNFGVIMKNIAILGSTGSIGTQTLDVVDKLDLKVSALTAANNITLLEQQVRKYKPALAVVFNEEKAKELQIAVADTATKVRSGMDGLVEAAQLPQADLVLNSVVGMVGLQPTIAAAQAKKDIALANKETLVAGGDLVTDAVRANNVRLLPVDSEHSAIFQCLQGMPDKKVLKKLILTASGGPFFGKTTEELRGVTVEQALRHPNWSMGAKITIDSATMMNKGLEIIEAGRLFDVSGDDIDVVVHRESIIHSLVEFTDNSVLAQLGVPDMRIPIQYAITYPMRYPSPVAELDLAQIGRLSFFEPDYDTFTCLRACKKAFAMGGAATAIANGANEEANALFRRGKIKFLEIGELVMGAVDSIPNFSPACVQDILDADRQARAFVTEHVGG